jgi:uncharacterized membrane protein HdeD (DUF308 family)
MQLILRGSLALGFAFALALWRTLPFGAVALLLGIYAFADGAMALAFRSNLQPRRPAELHMLEGLIIAGVGWRALRTPTASVEPVYLVALWAIGTGILRVSALLTTILDRRESRNDLVFAMGGALSVLIGFGFLISPATGRLLFAIILGPYAAIVGVALVRSAFRMRRALRSSARPAAGEE